MKKTLFTGLFAMMLFLSTSSVTAFADEVESLTETSGNTEQEIILGDEISNDQINTEEVIVTKPTNILGKLTLIGYSTNDTGSEDDFNFTVTKPEELAKYSLGEVTMFDYQYSPEKPNTIGYISLDYSNDDPADSGRLTYEVFDNGDTLRFEYTHGNMNMGNVMSDGQTPLNPFLGGEVAGPTFYTPDGAYDAFIRVIFTNVPQPNEDETVADSDSANTNVNNNEVEFVNNIKDNGDTSEKYVSGDKLPQTSQSSTVLSGLMLLMVTLTIGSYSIFNINKSVKQK